MGTLMQHFQTALGICRSKESFQAERRMCLLQDATKIRIWAGLWQHLFTERYQKVHSCRSMRSSPSICQDEVEIRNGASPHWSLGSCKQSTEKSRVWLKKCVVIQVCQWPKIFVQGAEVSLLMMCVWEGPVVCYRLRRGRAIHLVKNEVGKRCTDLFVSEPNLVIFQLFFYGLPRSGSNQGQAVRLPLLQPQ